MSSSDLRGGVDESGDRVRGQRRATVLGRLTDRRRAVLDRLLAADRAVRPRTLAARVAAAEGDADGDAASVAGVADETVDAVAVELEHRHLPVLESVDLVERTGADGAVAPTDHPLYEDADFRRFVRADADLDGAVECLTDGTRRRVLAALAAGDGRAERRGLAETVAGSATSPADELRATLHHVHLPKLDAHGFVDYDVERGVVERTPPPVDDEWVDLLTGR